MRTGSTLGDELRLVPSASGSSSGKLPLLDVEDILSKLNVDEKASLLSGTFILELLPPSPHK